MMAMRPQEGTSSSRILQPVHPARRAVAASLEASYKAEYIDAGYEV